MTNIENLKKEVDDIKNSLNELKNNVSLSEIEKKKKAETLKVQAETTKQKIQDEIHSLKTKTDDESKKKREEAETLLNSFSKIMNLYTSILNSTENEKERISTEKWFFWKVWDWIWEQLSDVWSKDKRKEQPWRNLLRIAWFVATWVWAVALAYNWVKNIWNLAFWDNEKNQEQDEKKSKKEKSFWKIKWGNLLKWAWITTATWWWIYEVSKLFSSKKENVEIAQEWWDTISDAMFQQLLYMEWDQDFVAKSHGKKFWENFVTGPYGMVYKHIDESGNLLKNTVCFKEGEHVSKDWAEKNARAYYNKRAKEWADLLRSKWYKYSQDMLDALVSASWGTKKSVDRLKNFVLSHWDDKDAIFDFMSKFATTAAWNWKTMPWLVIRRDFEANWFRWNKEPMSEYQRRYYA